MDTFTLLYIFIIGCLVGSFINVVALRYGTGLSSVSGRSQCPHCAHTLAWYELIPVISFIWQLGRCRVCHMRLSWRYVSVELLTGFLFVGLALRQMYYLPLYDAFGHGLLYSSLFFVYYAVISSLLLIILLYDLKHMIIPNIPVYTLAILGLIKLGLFIYCKGFVDTFVYYDLLSPLILSLPFVLLWVISRGRWIGLGDAKLVFGLGAVLGLISGVSAVILAFWIGAIWSVVAMIVSRLKGGEKLSLSSEVPFGPFLIIGFFIAFFTHIDVLGLHDLLSLL